MGLKSNQKGPAAFFRRQLQFQSELQWRIASVAYYPECQQLMDLQKFPVGRRTRLALRNTSRLGRRNFCASDLASIVKFSVGQSAEQTRDYESNYEYSSHAFILDESGYRSTNATCLCLNQNSCSCTKNGAPLLRGSLRGLEKTARRVSINNRQYARNSCLLGNFANALTGWWRPRFVLRDVGTFEPRSEACC